MKSPLHYTLSGISNTGKQLVNTYGTHWIAVDPPCAYCYAMRDHAGPFIPAVAITDDGRHRSGIWVSLGGDDPNFHVTPHQ